MAQASWSFEDNPYPKYGNLTPQEINLLEKKIEFTNTEKQCEYLINTQYQIYQTRYPEYKEFADDETYFQRWKLHMVASKNYESCMILSPMQSLVDSDSNLAYVHFYFCGRFSRSPKTIEEKEIAQTISELFEFAKTGDPAAVDLLLYANERTEIINLDPDFEYYFSKLAKPFINNDIPERNLSRFIPLLSEERRTFLDKIALNSRFEDLLITTLPCKTR